MTVFRLHERPTSRRQSYQLSFVAAGSTDDLFVRSYAISSTPAIVTPPQGILYRQDVEKDRVPALAFLEPSLAVVRRAREGTDDMSKHL